jgi:RHS repeat-associated protein
MWGNIVETRDYDPFGRTIGHTGDFALKHRFTGQPEREAAGAYDYGARLYEPDWGRLLSPDSYVQSFDSQGLHRYAYVLNRPTSLVDPTGNFVGGAGDGGLGAAIGIASGFTYGFLQSPPPSEPPRPTPDAVRRGASQLIYGRFAGMERLRPAIDVLRRLRCLADAETCQRPEDMAFRIGLEALRELFDKPYDEDPDQRVYPTTHEALEAAAQEIFASDGEVVSEPDEVVVNPGQAFVVRPGGFGNSVYFEMTNLGDTSAPAKVTLRALEFDSAGKPTLQSAPAGSGQDFIIAPGQGSTAGRFPAPSGPVSQPYGRFVISGRNMGWSCPVSVDS